MEIWGLKGTITKIKNSLYRINRKMEKTEKKNQ